MSCEFIEKYLYNPFTQERDSARSKYQGTGLDLAIVHNLIDIMQGTIRVDSEPDHGTTFTVTLPFDIGTEPVQTETSEVKADCIREMKVLLVEDNALNCEIAQALLEEYGAAVTTAADGRQAVELFKASPVHGHYDACPRRTCGIQRDPAFGQKRCCLDPDHRNDSKRVRGRPGKVL